MTTPPTNDPGEAVSRNSINITGGNFTGGNFAAGDHNRLTAHTGTQAARATPTDLRDALRAAHDQLVAAGSTPQDRQDIADDLRKILATLESGQPAETAAAPVRNRWTVVQGILGAAAAAGTAIAETTRNITDLIGAVFGGA